MGTTSLVGFGSSATGAIPVGGTIDLTGTALGPILDFSFTMPDDGIITAISDTLVILRH
ncbi:hypothetical protein [Bacillus sp. SRB3LM]|uniref:hypothetical protein n=1 Tax=Bacillus sp. SRB3LM TaxID=2608689 RepID=UPI0027DF4B4F|nr:hypothetical protein [Bacillus sp. SRB3LM]